MNSRQNHNSPLPADADETARLLEAAAERIAPDPRFTSNLEQRLVTSHPGPQVSARFPLNKLAPALLWVAAAALLILAIDWAIRSLAPEPVPASHSTPVTSQQAPAPPIDQSTPAPSGQGFDWRGTTLYLAAPLPDGPAEGGVYLAQPAPHATVEEALALAERFGIQGNIYQTPGEIADTADYLVTDGKQSLRMRSADYFSYTADIVKAYNYFGAVKNPDAEPIIGSFLQTHGFTFRYRVQWSDFRSAYIVEPLTAEDTPLRYEDYSPPMLLITLNQSGQVATFQASLIGVMADPVGTYGIISAQEALRRLLDPNTVNGMIESTHSNHAPIQQWSRSYPIDETVTIYGNAMSTAPIEPGKPPFVQIDAFPAIGDVLGLEQQFAQPIYVAATGRFVIDNGIQRFSIDSWKVSDIREDGLIGTLQRQDNQVTLDTQDGTHYLLPDVPADVPMPFEKAFVVGTAEGDIFQWKLIDDRMATPGGGGGGGGGGGSGFYKLNLAGPPVAVPSPSATAVIEGSGPSGSPYAAPNGVIAGTDASSYANGGSNPSMQAGGLPIVVPGSEPQRIEGLRGLLNVTISKQENGSQLVAYGFIADATSRPGGYMLLDGDNLEPLQAFNNRPVDIWGSMQTNQGEAIPVVKVERYEIPFPDLKVQSYEGTQRLAELAGETATLFTAENGQTYVQLLVDGTTGNSLIGREGDTVQVEGLMIPGEAFGGYPAIRLFGGGVCEGDVCNGGDAAAANEPNLNPMPSIGEPSEIPTATIEKVELVDFLSDPRYATALPNVQPPYFQPVWRFSGHYSNGDEFEILVQALRQEYLLPELEPALLPG